MTKGAPSGLGSKELVEAIEDRKVSALGEARVRRAPEFLRIRVRNVVHEPFAKCLIKEKSPDVRERRSPSSNEAGKDIAQDGSYTAPKLLVA